MKRKKVTVPSQPGPEHDRLGALAGTWDFTGELKPGPYGPGGLVTATDHNRIMPGGFFLERHYETRSPVGEFEGLEVIGYDAAAGAYFQHGYDSHGDAHQYRGTVEGDTWTFTYDTHMGGKKVRGRITLRDLSPIRQSYRMETSANGRTWTTVLGGALTKR